jgi:hypothetical protein
VKAAMKLLNTEALVSRKATREMSLNMQDHFRKVSYVNYNTTTFVEETDCSKFPWYSNFLLSLTVERWRAKFLQHYYSKTPNKFGKVNTLRRRIDKKTEVEVMGQVVRIFYALIINLLDFFKQYMPRFY